jgi:hypothetical protein
MREDGSEWEGYICEDGVSGENIYIFENKSLPSLSDIVDG